MAALGAAKPGSHLINIDQTWARRVLRGLPQFGAEQSDCFAPRAIEAAALQVLKAELRKSALCGDAGGYPSE